MAGSISTVGVARRDRRSIKQFRLTVIRGVDKGKSHDSNGARVGVGTHPSNDFQLTDRTLSRFHCEIVIIDGRPVIRDLGSRNGTDVAGTEVQVAYLKTKQLLTLGQTQVRFELRDAELDLPLSNQERFGLLVGRSEVMRTVFARLERAAQSDSTVLLLGETGTGKDLAAESIHAASGRKNGPFVIVDCAALPPTLIEAELFGFEKGAFTGADRAQRGAFEAAHGGTLFLDELGELPLDLQPKFLRAIESRTVQRIGARAPASIDVRIIAATNRPLRQEVNTKRFRADLYFRLAILEIELPPLRDRRDDIPLIVEEMLVTMTREPNEVLARLEAKQLLRAWQAQPWPGNVRELRNQLERYLAVPDDEQSAVTQGSDHWPVDVDQPFQLVREQWLQRLERSYLEALLDRHGGNATKAMRAANIPRVQFYRMIRRSGLKR
ncbi:MAG: sigma 54-interacting transcriptional regulator [Kofleriaceae bacterium]